MPVKCLDNFRTHPYISNFFNGRDEITNFQKYQIAHRDIVHEKFNAKIFLDACGIETDVYKITKEQVLELSEKFGNDNYTGLRSGLTNHLKSVYPDAFKKELEVGKWMKTPNGGLYFLKEKQGNGFICYGFTPTSRTYKEIFVLLNITKDDVEATPQEVEAALICEAKKRGFKKGARYLSAWNNEAYCIYPQDLYYNAKKNCLATHDGNKCIFQNGKWATIIQPEKMTLEQIEKELGRKIEIV